MSEARYCIIIIFSTFHSSSLPFIVHAIKLLAINWTPPGLWSHSFLQLQSYPGHLWIYFLISVNRRYSPACNPISWLQHNGAQLFVSIWNNVFPCTLYIPAPISFSSSFLLKICLTLYFCPPPSLILLKELEFRALPSSVKLRTDKVSKFPRGASVWLHAALYVVGVGGGLILTILLSSMLTLKDNPCC